MGPAVFVIDDLHWAGAEVLECLGRLDWPVLAGTREMVKQSRRTVVLQPLDSEQIGQLACSMCGPVECPELYAWSQGHPLLAASLLRNLYEKGSLRVEGLGCGELSPNLEGVLRRRCQALSPSAQQTLQQAAWLGRRFEPELLDSAGGLEEGQKLGLIFRFESFH